MCVSIMNNSRRILVIYISESMDAWIIVDKWTCTPAQKLQHEIKKNYQSVILVIVDCSAYGLQYSSIPISNVLLTASNPTRAKRVLKIPKITPALDYGLYSLRTSQYAIMIELVHNLALRMFLRFSQEFLDINF